MPDDPEKHTSCLKCGYWLTGLAEPRCPECGRAFDPLDPRTFRSGRLGGAVRFLSSPPGRVLNAAIVVVALLSCLSVSAPGGYFLVQLFALLGWFFVGLVWIARVAISVYLTRRHVPPDHRPARSRGYLVGPVVVLVVAGAITLRIPYWCTFWVSRPFMDALAARAMTNNDPLPQKWFIGLYPVERIERIPGGVQFFIAHAGFLSEEGFVYVQPPPRSVGPSWKRRPGGWFEFYKSF